MHSVNWQEPLFIIGNPRSGTSLLRLMLDSHPNICIPPESHFFLWLEDKYKQWDESQLDNYIDDLTNSDKFETWKLDKLELSSYLKSKKISSYAHLNSLVYLFFDIKRGNQTLLWGDKNGLWSEKLNRIKYHYPNAFYIHIVRDGRDVAASYKNLNKRKIDVKYAPRLPENILDIAATWNKNVKAINSYLNTISAERQIHIRYEDLIINPKETLIKAMSILELDFKDVQITYYNRKQEDIEPKSFIQWKEKLMVPPVLSNIGKFEHELSFHEIQLFNEISHELLVKYEYL